MDFAEGWYLLAAAISPMIVKTQSRLISVDSALGPLKDGPQATERLSTILSFHFYRNSLQSLNDAARLVKVLNARNRPALTFSSRIRS